MLDRFRPELLAQVLEHHDLSDRHQQRRALYSCCFVSRYVSDVAQPALWKRIEVYDFWQAKSVIAGKDDETRALATRELEITCPEFDSETETIRLPIASLLEALPRIRKLAFRGKVRTIQDDEALAMNGLTCVYSHISFPLAIAHSHPCSPQSPRPRMGGFQSLFPRPLRPTSDLQVPLDRQVRASRDIRGLCGKACQSKEPSLRGWRLGSHDRPLACPSHATRPCLPLHE